jgi:hypothetical protein
VSIRKVISEKLLRIVLLIKYRNFGALISEIGSITSPMEIFVQNSVSQGNKARELKSMLLPTILVEDEYIRVGSKGNGGYILAKSVFENAKYLISGGIQDNNDFEL